MGPRPPSSSELCKPSKGLVGRGNRRFFSKVHFHFETFHLFLCCADDAWLPACSAELEASDQLDSPDLQAPPSSCSNPSLLQPSASSCSSSFSTCRQPSCSNPGSPQPSPLPCCSSKSSCCCFTRTPSQTRGRNFNPSGPLQAALDVDDKPKSLAGGVQDEMDVQGVFITIAQPVDLAPERL